MLRAGWLFDGTGSALIPDPVVVLEGSTILGAGSGGRVPHCAAVIDLAGATLLAPGWWTTTPICPSAPAPTRAAAWPALRPESDAYIRPVDGDPIADPAALHRIRAVYTRGAAVPGAGT